MNCQSAQSWLLEAEDLRPKSWPKDLVAHVKTCSGCVKVANALGKLEKSWHEQSFAVESDQAKARFLCTIARPAASKTGARRLFTKMPPIRLVAVASLILVVLTAFGWMLVSPDQSRASSDVVDRLFELNLDMANANSLQERKRLFDEHVPALRLDLQKSQSILAPEDRELADDLLAHGVWLVSNEDLIEEADRTNGLADKLADRVDAATKKVNPKESDHSQLLYYKFMHRGVQPIEFKINQMKLPEKKEEWKKGSNQPRWMNPLQFQQKQQELLKSFDALRKKGSRFKGFGFGQKR